MAEEPPTPEPEEAPQKAPSEAPEAFRTGGFTVNTEGASLMGIVGAASGVGLAAYLIAVVLQGNLQPLIKLLQTEEPYLEFAVAIVIVWALMKYGPTSEVTDLLVVGAVAGVALKLAGRLNIGTAVDSFAQGKTGILQTVETVFKQNPTGNISGGTPTATR
jgi:hypothetical protein